MKSSYIFLILLSLLFSSCKSVQQLPLCKRLSDTKPSVIDGIPINLFKICEDKNIKITVISGTVAEFEGNKKDIEWLLKNYPIIICDFDFDKIPLKLGTYRSCLLKVGEWINIVKLERFDMFSIETVNYNICIE